MRLKTIQYYDMIDKQLEFIKSEKLKSIQSKTRSKTSALLLFCKNQIKEKVKSE